VQRPKQLRSIYSVNGKVPGFTADFIKNKYPGHTSLSSAITHARAGNATMTDGYGPELVVNGGFDSDSDWTKGDGWSIANGVATSDGSQSSSSALQAVDILTIGTTYEVTFTVVSRSAGSITARLGTSGVGTTRTATGTYRELITCAGTDDVRMTASNDFVGSIDSVSVREMPVIKWAPHNLLTYSEDFSNADWTKNSTVESVDDGYVSPNGDTTATRLLVTNVGGTGSGPYVNQSLTVTSNSNYTASVFAKADQTNWLYFQLAGFTSPAEGGVWFDLSNGTTGTEESGYSGRIVSVGGGWFLCSVSFAIASDSSGSVRIEAVGANEGESVSLDGLTSIYIWGAHLYRSDLGGMVDNPDQPLSRASYVPTTSAAKYLPRIGHHVYNGSAWANEGVLAESEQRVNLLTYSQDFSQWTNTRSSDDPDSATAPDGTETATSFYMDSTAASTHIIKKSATIVASSTNTFSVFVKPNGLNFVRLMLSDASVTDYFEAFFDVSSGDVGTTGDGASGTFTTATIEDTGNGWYRCSITGVVSSDTAVEARIYLAEADNDATIDGDGSSGIYIYGAQVEEGSTPSSYIPTSGQQGTREAETFTIPSANLPWGQSYGTEVSASSWTGSSWDTFTSTGDDFSANKSTAGGTDHAYSNTAVTVVNGQSVKIDVDFDAGTNTQAVIGLSSTTNARSNNVIVDPSAGGTKSVTVTATQSGTFSISVRTTQIGTINVTGARAAVATNNPVSIAMEGRMTYADDGATVSSNAASGTALPFRWRADSTNYITHVLSTETTNVGTIWFMQENGGTFDYVLATDEYSPDILVPFNVASRHGSTFINGAVDGVALTANTTPTALPDLSSTDLELAYDYMGTISEFRVWDKDITDDGLVEATNPSLEPSLSLEFSGTGTNSFTVSDWSE